MAEQPINLRVRDGASADDGMEGAGSDDDDCFASGDDESSESSDVEDILVDFDNEGLPKKNSEDNRGVPKLPPGFQVPVGKKQRRFRKAYAGPSIAAHDLFTKAGAMTKLFGKLDRNMDRATADFLSVDADAPDDAQTPISKEESLRKYISNWLLLMGTVTPSSPEIKEKFISIFLTHLTKMSEKTFRSKIQWGNLFRSILAVMLSIRSKLQDTSLHFVSLKTTLLSHLMESIEEKIAEKNTMIDYLQLYSQTKMITPPEFDESSNWGLKPLRHTFMPPYFKNLGAQVAAPPIFRGTGISKLIILMTSTKQKWTVKDLTELQTSIRKTVLEKRLVEAKELADQVDTYFHSGDQAERDTKIFEEVNNPNTKEEIKESGFRNRSGRGREGKSASQSISPVALMSPAFEDMPCALRTCKSSAEVRKWYKRESERIERISYQEIFDENGTFTMDDVDWDVVSAKLMNRTKKLRLAADCRNCFAHAANPMFYNKRRWAQKEKDVLKMHSTNNKPWREVSSRLSNRRPEFVVFYKWKKMFNRPRKMHWGAEKIELTKKKLQIYGANWNKLPVELNDFAATKKQMQERFKKTLNPILRFGKFTRVEDSLMLLTIEKLKGNFRREKHFGILTAFLPWRYESAWRDRVENLFSEYIVPWTLEEDGKLLNLASSMKRDWSKIAMQFKSFKSRKGCLTRYKILEKRLRTFKSLKDYHDSYSMTRYNIREYSHLQDISALLKGIVTVPAFTFMGLPRDRAPTEDELIEFILSFDREIMASTIQVIDIYLEKRDEYWNEWRKANGVIPGEKKKTHDRRTFHKENTQSIASALHIRDVKLTPQDSLKFELTVRESEIYRFYARFCSTKPLKKDTPRPYIPPAEELVKLPDVRRIVLKDRQGRAKAKKRASAPLSIPKEPAIVLNEPLKGSARAKRKRKAADPPIVLNEPLQGSARAKKRAAEPLIVLNKPHGSRAKKRAADPRIVLKEPLQGPTRSRKTASEPPIVPNEPFQVPLRATERVPEPGIVLKEPRQGPVRSRKRASEAPNVPNKPFQGLVRTKKRVTG